MTNGLTVTISRNHRNQLLTNSADYPITCSIPPLIGFFFFFFNLGGGINTQEQVTGVLAFTAASVIIWHHF